MTPEEDRLDRRLGYLRSFMQSAWNSELAEAEALKERLEIELLLGGEGPARGLMRAAVHYLDDVIKQRREKEVGGHLGRHALSEYLALFVEGLRP